MALFEGAGVALVTPFRQDDSVDYEELKRLLEFQITEGVDAIIVCGTTGEPATMTEEERLSVIDFTVKEINRRVPVIAGSGGNCTKAAVEFSKKVQDLGVDGLLVVTPYYNKATQEGLYAHYKAIAEAVDLPIIMYNVQSRTGVNLLPETAVRLGKEFVNIVAVKEASGNISQVAELLQKAEGYLDVYSGNDDQIIPILSLGGKGVISVCANIIPGETHDMVMEYLKGNREEARRLQLKYLNFIHDLFLEVNPIPVKKALELMGYKSMRLRLPLTEMEEAHVKVLWEEMVKLGLAWD